MNYSDVLHEHNQQKEEPYWWITYSIIVSVGFLLGIAFIIGPVILFLIYKSIWLLLLLILMPLGYFMVKGIYKGAKGLIWRNNHLSYYVLKNDQILFEDWKEESPHEANKGSFQISSIDYVVSSWYIVRETVNYNNSFLSGSRKLTETAPILYIIFTENSRKKLLSIPFYTKDGGINVWLKHFKENNISLKHTNYVLYRKYEKTMNDENKLQLLESSDQLLSYTFDHNWFDQSPDLWAEWIRKFASEPEHISNGNSAKMNAKTKLTAKKWFGIALRVYPLLIVGIYIAIWLAEAGIISDDGPIAGFVILTITSTLYFILLKSHLRWYHMIRFLVESFILCLIISLVAEEQSKIAEEVTTGILGASMIFIAIVWIPFLIIRLKRKSS